MSWSFFVNKNNALPYFLSLIIVALLALLIGGGEQCSAPEVSVLSPARPVQRPMTPLTVQLPVEKYGLPGEVDENGSFRLLFPPEIKRVFFEVGLYINPSFCELPMSQPDVFVFAWEANEQSWTLHHDRCFQASGGKYIALPFAAADSDVPLVWNTHAAQDACASLASGAGPGVKPPGWIEDPVARATQRCQALVDAKTPIMLWDEPLNTEQVFAKVPLMIEACGICKNNHAPGVNKRVRVPTLSFESVLMAIPEHIVVERVRIDAQGADLAVLKSAKSQMHRIQSVNLEAQNLPTTDPDFLYGGPLVANMHGVIEEMKRLGFQRHTADVNNCACSEYNLNFYRS